ncbi:unnamed protein product [Rotaria sp. Silwood1]|nr:unnamed protein product [Rotaria sp. Silwood1]CAF4958963.1 unnamed protein product [Rotaria sp. Silwood1]
MSQQGKHYMAENYFVIWAHNSTDPANQACQNILAQLRDVVNEVKSCSTIEEFIQTLNENKEKLAFIVCSGTFSQYLVPDIHDMEKNTCHIHPMWEQTTI